MFSGVLIAFMSVVDALCDVGQHLVVNHSELNPEVVVPAEGEEGLLETSLSFDHMYQILQCPQVDVTHNSTQTL